MEQQQQPTENMVLSPPVTLNIIVPPPILNNTLPQTSPTNINQLPLPATSPTNVNLPPTPATSPTNINLPPIPATSPTNIHPPPIPTSIINQTLPTSINPPPIQTNANSFAPSIPLQSLPQMPPLGPAPAQLPPLAHPPPVGSIPTNHATIQETTFDSSIPVQGQFETLNLNSPTQPMPPVINNEANATQELVDGNSMATPPSDLTSVVNPNGEAPLAIPGEEKRNENLNHSLEKYNFTYLFL